MCERDGEFGEDYGCAWGGIRLCRAAEGGDGLAALLAVALGFHVIFGQHGLIVYKQKREETRLLDEQMERLRVENERLKDHAARLESSPDAIEHEAREELHYARPGEVIYTMPVKPAAAVRP